MATRETALGSGLLCLVLLSAGCLPFFGGRREPPRTPEAVERFAAAAGALGIPPSPPPMPEVTHTLAAAVESLPNAPGAGALGQKIDAEAQAMHGAATDAAARRSLSLAIEALEQMRRPAGSKKDRARALDEVRRAVGVDDGYRAAARALVLFTGGQPDRGSGGELPALVARFAVEDADAARRTGAQVIYAIADALGALHVDAGDLRRRADRLTDAAPLEYAPALREALARAVDALGRLHVKSPALESLRAQAREAVQRIAPDRPFDLQRPVAQDALRLISDAITVAARSGARGR